MKSGRLGAAEKAQIAEIVDRWSEFLLREIFEESLCEMDIDSMEEAGVFCGDALARKLSESLLQGRSVTLEEAVCPDCGTHCDIEQNDRTLLLRRGEVRWSEPKAHCPQCQRDFFPSADGVAS